MSGFFQQARAVLSQELQKFRNRPFLEATMAASALVASADGEINFAKLTMLDQSLAAATSVFCLTATLTEFLKAPALACP